MRSTRTLSTVEDNPLKRTSRPPAWAFEWHIFTARASLGVLTIVEAQEYKWQAKSKCKYLVGTLV